MQLNEYQQAALEFAAYDDELYPFLGLAEETGEFVGLMARVLRGDDLSARFPDVEGFQKALLKEAGDVLWQLSMCLQEMGLTLEEAATENLLKLASRKTRGVIKGSGDER